MQKTSPLAIKRIMLSAFVIILAACSSPGKINPSTPFPTLAIPGTLQANSTGTSAAGSQAAPTETLAPTQAPAPTSVASPVPSLTPAPASQQGVTTPASPVINPGSLTRIYLEIGATSTVISGTLTSGQTMNYVLYGLANRVLMAKLTANNPGKLSLADTNGNALTGAVVSSDGTNAWVPLTSSMDYMIGVTAGSQAINYKLTVTMPYTISFSQGSSEDTEYGLVTKHNTVDYVVSGSKGQTLTVSVTSPDGSMVLNIYGLTDGTSLVKTAETRSKWTGVLPSTQDYVIEVVPYIVTATFTVVVNLK